MESLDSLSVDIARMIDHDAAAELWDRYKRGERNVFTRRLYTMQGQKTFEEIRKRYRGDREFKQTVDRYIGEFERLLKRSRRTSAARRRRAAISPRIPARSTPCWRTRPGGSTSRDRARELNQGRAASAPLSFAREFWHRGAHGPLTLDCPHRTLADRRRLHHRARRQDRSRSRGRGDRATARIDGRGECVPYARYGETVAGVTAAIEAMRGAVGGGLDRAGAASARCRRAPRATRSIARSGISRPRRAGRPVHALAGLPAPQPLVTAYTISLGTPGGDGARRPRKAAARKLLKVKLGGEGDPARIARGARGRAECRADRRCQRGVARRRSRATTSRPARRPA